MKMINRKIELLLFITLITSSGCLEDVIPPPFTGELNKTAEMLIYFEELGDFANSGLAPALIGAQEVFDNINNYLIIDLRTNDEYVSGHIENAINVSTDSLLTFIQKNNDSTFTKIIIVSKNGQSSAYFTCLLRLAGYDKIYTLNYGMASWNIVFAEEWLNALGDDPEILFYNNDTYPKNEFTSLPEQPGENGNLPIQQFVMNRIEQIFSDGFVSDVTYRRNMVIFSNDYPVCYGNSSRLYFARRVGALAGLGHRENVIFYMANPLFEFRSVNFLQTLPINKTILIYGANGQLSACISAYLRVLGYKAVTLLFGANQLFYSRMIDDPELIPYLFSASEINNFEYVTGN